jgi:hypothetical protein
MDRRCPDLYLALDLREIPTTIIKVTTDGRMCFASTYANVGGFLENWEYGPEHPPSTEEGRDDNEKHGNLVLDHILDPVRDIHINYDWDRRAGIGFDLTSSTAPSWRLRLMPRLRNHATWALRCALLVRPGQPRPSSNGSSPVLQVLQGS